MSFIWREPVKTTVQSDDFLPLTIPEPTVAIEDAKFQCEAKKAVVSSRLEAEVKRLGKEQRDEIAEWSAVAPVNEFKSFQFAYADGLGVLRTVVVKSTKEKEVVQILAKTATAAVTVRPLRRVVTKEVKRKRLFGIQVDKRTKHHTTDHARAPTDAEVKLILSKLQEASSKKLLQ